MNASGTTRGFTFVELVTIVGLVAFAGILMVPALAHTKPNDQMLHCLNNLRQLGGAWRMYADDNGGKLVYNGDSPRDHMWVGGWLDYSSSSDNTNTALLTDHAMYPNYAYLGPYLKSPEVFKCPADRSTVKIAGQPWARVRSVSMNWWVGAGTRDLIWRGRGPAPLQLYQTIDSLAKPIPSDLWIILDEREESINDGAMITAPDIAWTLVDFPAGYHERGAGVVFGDGHSEIHRWSDARTTLILQPGQPLPTNTTMPGNVDITWLNEHATSQH